MREAVNGYPRLVYSAPAPLATEPDPTIAEALLALLELLWRVLTLGPRLVAMMSIAIAESIRP